MNVHLVYKYTTPTNISRHSFEHGELVSIFINKIDAYLHAERLNESTDDKTAYVVETRQVHESLETANV